MFQPSNARARVSNIQAVGDVPGTFQADLVMGRADVNGVNTFTITADGITQNVVIFIE